MNPDELYLATIADLEKKLADRSPYAIIRGAGLIRQLFLDGHKSLIDKVNRTHKLKLIFAVQRPFFLIVDNFQVWNPSVRPVAGLPYLGRAPLQLNRDDFLAHQFAAGQGVAISVADMIGFCANVAGGVHHGNAKSDEEQLLAQMHRETAVKQEISSVIFGVAGIIEVVIDSLAPLTDAVKAELEQRRN